MARRSRAGRVADSHRMSAEPEKAPVDVSSDVDMEKPKSNKKTAKGGKAGKSKESLDSQKFEFGDIVLARLRGFPPWREFSTASA